MHARTAILWFRRDLRLHDHPALVGAIERADLVVPLFVLDPRLLHGRFASANRTWFLLGSLAALRTSLRAIGSDLVVRVGDPRVVVPSVAAATGAVDVFVSRDHAPYGRARDRAVAEALEAVGATWHARTGNLVHEPEAVVTADGGPFSVYSPFRRTWERLDRRGILPPPSAMPGPVPIATVGGGTAPLDPGPIPTLDELGFRSDEATADLARLPEPGEAAARGRLERWLAGGLAEYADRRDRLDLEDGTSRLSADLHLGLLSPLEVVERAGGSGHGPHAYRNELVWREFYANILAHRPSLRSSAFQAAFDALPWTTDETVVAAWRDGFTGYPVVDAAMRQLRHDGWMHNRARMIVASFLTKHLLVDWRVGEAWFMRNLVDGDVASNNGGWQWSASTGTDPQPYFRIFNPVLQGRRHDPDGTFVRRWLPELERVPTAQIHAPWKLSRDEQAAAGCVIGRDYPAPIVDHADARARALAAYEAARRAATRRG